MCVCVYLFIHLYICKQYLFSKRKWIGQLAVPIVSPLLV